MKQAAKIGAAVSIPADAPVRIGESVYVDWGAD